MKKDIGDLFQKETKYLRGKLGGGALFWQSQPETYKRYPKAPKVKLEIPEKDGGMPLWQAINRRRSVRSFSDTSKKSYAFPAPLGFSGNHMGIHGLWF